MEPTLSCIIPTRNRWALLQRALASARGPGVEILLVDDASTDDTACQGPNLPGVRYLRANGAGVAAARNRGAALATGPWLAFLDDDDQWLPGKTSHQMAWLAARGGAFGSTGWLEVRADGSQVPHPGPEAGPVPWGRLLRGSFVNTSTVLVRRELFVQAGGFDESLGTAEDWDLWLRMARLSPLCHLPEPWTRSEMREGDRLTANRERLWRDMVTVQEHHLPDSPPEWRAEVLHVLASTWLRVAWAACRRGAVGPAGRALVACLRRDPGCPVRHLARRLGLRAGPPKTS